VAGKNITQKWRLFSLRGRPFSPELKKRYVIFDYYIFVSPGIFIAMLLYAFKRNLLKMGYLLNAALNSSLIQGKGISQGFERSFFFYTCSGFAAF
jgi:hypothetical protein